ncbi:hypothetical protein MMC06_002893 [Schaereria dolodes]|nr:hypothetical protein [Schaereria dolodes]
MQDNLIPSRRPSIPRVDTVPILTRIRPPLLQTTSEPSQDKSRHSPRPPSPFPSSAASIRSFRFSAATFGSSLSSRYLSPPLHDADDESAPFKPTNDDSISLNMHRKPKKKRKGRHQPGRESNTTRTIDFSASPLFSISESQAVQSGSLSLRSCESNSELSEGDNATNLDELKATPSERQISERPWRRLGSIVSSDPSPSSQQSFLETIQNRWSTPAKERYKTFRANYKKPNWASIDTKNSEDSAVSNSQKQPSLPSHSATRAPSIVTAFAPPPARYQKPSAEPNISRGRRLETPATITLRKASGGFDKGPSRGLQLPDPQKPDLVEPNACDFMTVSMPSETQLEASTTDAQGPRPEVDKLESYGGISYGVDCESRNEIQSLSDFSRVITADRLCAYSIQKRHSVIIDPAVTFADVHMVPKRLSTTSKSRKDSLLAVGALRRKSTSHICSDGSIHEIIWKDDDSPSSWSSSPIMTSQSLEVSGAEGSSPEEPAIEGHSLKARNEPLCYTNSEIDRSPEGTTTTNCSNVGISDASHGLYGWSWTDQKPKNAREEVKFSAERERNSSADDSRNREIHPQTHRGKPKRQSGSDVPSVESFPPLLDRRSTSEWRKAPIIDLNDPVAGREDDDADIRPKSKFDGPTLQTADSAEGCGGREQTSAQRKNSASGRHSISSSRIRQDSKIGSSLGASTHIRRRSSTKSPQNPGCQKMNMPKDQIRKGSTLTLGLSDNRVPLSSEERANDNEQKRDRADLPSLLDSSTTAEHDPSQCHLEIHSTIRP